MDDKKPRVGGTKVSQIANIFQNKAPIREDIITPLRSKTKLTESSSDKKDIESPSVTVMRTESHVARFNNARALFEKLGEENRCVPKEKVIPLQSTKSASSILDLRSRSSSANSETRDTKSHQGSRSPSPVHKDNLNNFSNSVPVLNSVPPIKSNGHNGTVPEHEKVTRSDDERTKPAIMKKPEKPERKFNSRELIEKQRNWTSHFSKTRTSSRFNSDPNKAEVKLAVTNGNKDATGMVATRSASFNNKLRSPPTSPPPPPERTEASRRPNVVRRDRPASVIPTTNLVSNKKDVISHRRSFDKDITVVSSPNSKEKTSPTKTGSNTVFTNKQDHVPKSLLSKELLDKDVRAIEHSSQEESLKSKSPSQDSLRPSSTTSSCSSRSPVSTNKSPLEDKDRIKDNLSGTSGSLSSISPPSSPSRVRTENEKQEQECNEKFSFEGITYYSILLSFIIL